MLSNVFFSWQVGNQRKLNNKIPKYTTKFIIRNSFLTHLYLKHSNLIRMQEIGSLLLIYLPKEFFNNKKTKKPLTKVKTVFFLKKISKL